MTHTKQPNKETKTLLTPTTNKHLQQGHRTEVHIQKSMIFLYISNEYIEFKVKNTVVFTLASNKNKVA